VYQVLFHAQFYGSYGALRSSVFVVDFALILMSRGRRRV
jgi:hypothetical protein